MIDLHTHALPQFDDGAKDLQESISMLTDSYAQGVRLCALTPHCTVHCREDVSVFVKRRADSYELLKSGAAGHSIPELLLGCELYMDHDISAYDNIKELCLQNTSSLMVELPPVFKPKWLSNCVYSLGLRGISVIIAHVDRYPYANKVFDELEGLDVCYQLNSARFLTVVDRMNLRKFFKRDELFFVSSDMHNTTDRVCTMEKAYTCAQKHFRDRAYGLFYENAQLILNNGL